jgi:hypothetical protein
MNAKSPARSNAIEWLLEEDNPSIRYYTLTDLLGRRPSDPAVIVARKAIMTRGPVPTILAKQKEGGYWGVPQDFYIRSKYKGTVWTIIILAELGVDGSDTRVRQAGEFILDNSQDRESGGFAYYSGSAGGDHAKVIPCLTGNMVFSLIRFGLLDDPRVRHGIEWLTRYMRFDGGDGRAPKGWPYDRRDNCWGKHTCMMGMVKGLKALAEIPAYKRTAAVATTIEKSTEYILQHHIYRRSHNPAETARDEWTRFGFPLMAGTHALEMLGILTRLGCRDPRMQEAIDLVLSKQDREGRWLMDKSLNGRFIVRLESDGKPSKWVTLNALRALQALSR